MSVNKDGIIKKVTPKNEKLFMMVGQLKERMQLEKGLTQIMMSRMYSITQWLVDYVETITTSIKKDKLHTYQIDTLVLRGGEYQPT